VWWRVSVVTVLVACFLRCWGFFMVVGILWGVCFVTFCGKFSVGVWFGVWFGFGLCGFCYWVVDIVGGWVFGCWPVVWGEGGLCGYGGCACTGC